MMILLTAIVCRSKTKWYKLQTNKKLALNSQLQTTKTSDDQILILCLSYFITTVTESKNDWTFFSVLMQSDWLNEQIYESIDQWKKIGLPKSEGTKQMEPILNFQVPSEGLELVTLLHCPRINMIKGNFDTNYFKLLMILSSLQKSEFLKLIVLFLHYFWCQIWNQWHKLSGKNTHI